MKNNLKKMKSKGLKVPKVVPPKKLKKPYTINDGNPTGGITKFYSPVKGKQKPMSLKQHMKRYKKLDIFKK